MNKYRKIKKSITKPEPLEQQKERLIKNAYHHLGADYFVRLNTSISIGAAQLQKVKPTICVTNTVGASYADKARDRL